MKRADNPGQAVILRAIDERRWLRHGLFWVADFAWVVWLILFGFHSATDWWNVLRHALLLTAMHMVVTYPLLYWVVPALWQQDRRGRLPLLLAGWFVLGICLNYAHRYYILIPMRLTEKTAYGGYRMVFAPMSNPVVLATAGVAACLRVYRRWRQQALNNIKLIRENYQAELRLLQAQIQPHFLFNTLNNLYALTLKQSDQAPDMIDRLTGLLRFVIEQGNANQITLRDEVALLRDYVALEQLRYGARLTLDFQDEGLEAAGGDTPSISPLLLLPLVENAFKHGAAEMVGPSHIGIALAVVGSRFTCVITNTRPPAPAVKSRLQGIGLGNVQQRLNLLYPSQHSFEVEDADEVFRVRLELQLNRVGASDSRLNLPAWLQRRAKAGLEQPLEPAEQPLLALIPRRL